MDWVIDDAEISYVSLDDVEGGFRATNYLIEAGHRRIACVYPDDHIPGIQRYQGYRKALETHGIAYYSQFDKPCTILTWNEGDEISRRVKELIALEDERPSAVFFFNDAAAFRGYAVIREAGLKIPDDISIMGFDDSEMAALADIPLTSVIHPKYQIGRWAAEILFEDIEQKSQKTHRQMIIKPTIAIRNSVKPLSSKLKVS
jgi:GntR family transcriptional regulator of arabinose operon